MTKRILPLFVAVAALLGAAGLGISKSGDKIRVLIIDGSNNHNWKDTTPFMKEQLEGTGKFQGSVATTPPNGAKVEDWKTFNPDFSKCDVVLSNYNGSKWEPESVRDSFEKFLNDGKRIVMLPIESLAVPVAVASWGKLLNLRGVDVEKIEEFVAVFENKGPERFPRSSAC